MRKMTRAQAILGLLMLLGAPLASAGVDGQALFTQGNGKGATACAVCHGPDGAGNAAAGFPRLAGMGQAYLAKQLKDFRGQKRINATMNGVAETLSDEEISAVAAYIAQRQTAPAKTSVSKDLHQQGEKLAVYGNWDKDVPACFRCHGDKAQGVPPAMPALAGQHQTYLQTQLQSWKQGQRSNDPVGLMTAIASRLSDEEISAVAAYLSTLTPPGIK